MTASIRKSYWNRFEQLKLDIDFMFSMHKGLVQNPIEETGVNEEMIYQCLDDVHEVGRKWRMILEDINVELTCDGR